MTHTQHKLLDFLSGGRDTLPLILAASPFGALYGALAYSADISFASCMAMSIFVFAGSSQFIAVNLMLASTPVLVIVVTTFFVNLRHLMYSANLMRNVQTLSGPLRAIMAFWLTDETFAVVSKKLNQDQSGYSFHWYYLGSAIFMYLNWQFWSAFGFFFGSQLENPASWGLDIAMVVAFIGVIAPRLNNQPMRLCFLCAFVSSIVCADWPYNTGLMFSMLLSIVIGMLSRQRQGQLHG